MSANQNARADKVPQRDGHIPNSKLKTQNSKPKTQNSKLCCVCVGAGRSSRFDGDKLSRMLGERTVFAAALRALETACPSAPMVVVAAPEKIDFWRDRLGPQFPRALVVAGGAHRHQSVRAGVTAAVELGAEVVVIHDAARPLVDPRDVQNVVRGLGDADGAVLITRVTDTVKRVAGDNMVVATVEREGLCLALTPQVFRVSSLEAAWVGLGDEEEWTDESAILERAGMRVLGVTSRFPNPKLTTPPDLALIRALAGFAP